MSVPFQYRLKQPPLLLSSSSLLLLHAVRGVLLACYVYFHAFAAAAMYSPLAACLLAVPRHNQPSRDIALYRMNYGCAEAAAAAASQFCERKREKDRKEKERERVYINDAPLHTCCCFVGSFFVSWCVCTWSDKN